MNMFRNLDSNLIISIGVSLILCGAVVYYYNTRMSYVELAIMRQNQVLSSFIANVQNQLKVEDLSTQEARVSAAAQTAGAEEKTADPHKIVVSDDDDDDDDDDDSSSESDTEDEDEDNEAKDEKIIISNVVEESNIKEVHLNDNTTHFIKIVDINDLSSFMNEVHVENIDMDSFNKTSTIYEIKDESSEDEDDSDDDDETEGQVEPVEVKAPVEVKEIKIKVEPSEQTPLRIDQMRVDDLRKLVLDKNLSTKEEVKKLKKPELLFLLKPNTL